MPFGVGIFPCRINILSIIITNIILIMMLSMFSMQRVRAYVTRSSCVSSSVRKKYHKYMATSTSTTNSDTLSDQKPGARISASLSSSSQVPSPPLSDSALQPPKGTRDFYPEDYRLRDWLFTSWRNVAKSYGFEEYDTSVLESEDLYIRKSGEEIVSQLYNFEDKGQRRVTLRPEMTPSLARMILAKKQSLSLPLKWFAIPQCWRYERMTKGRRREHYQWNMDIWGVSGVEAEAELLSAVVSFLKSVGLTANDVGIKVNSRKVLSAVMSSCGIAEDSHTKVSILIDKMDKISRAQLIQELKDVGLSEETISKFLDMLQNPEQLISTLSASSSDLASFAAYQEIERLLKLLEAYEISSWVRFDPTIVRGLSYYTGIVFEGFDRSGELRAICGGGRYDSLLETFSGKPSNALPAVGFGFGDAVIMELLKSKKLIPDTNRRTDIDVMIFAMNSFLRMPAMTLANQLRGKGLKIDLMLEDKPPKWAFSRADKIGAGVVLMLGESEMANNRVIIKDMQTSKQSLCELNEVANHILTIVKER